MFSCYIHLDARVLASVLKIKNGKKLPPEEVFGKVFKMNKSVLKKPSYHVSSISTDGIGCTITFTLDGQSTKRGGKKKKTGKEDEGQKLSELSEEKRIELKNQTVIGVDPGKFVLIQMVSEKALQMPVPNISLPAPTLDTLPAIPPSVVPPTLTQTVSSTTTAPSAHPPVPPAHTGAPLPCPPATTMEPNKKWMSQHKLRYTLKQRARETETKRIAQRRAKFEKEKNIKRTEEELIKKFFSSSTKTSEEERC
jgi:hypothetical protein